MKFCTRAVEILNWHVGGLNSGLFPLIFVLINTFFTGAMFYSVPVYTFRNGSKVKWCVAGADCKFTVELWKAHMFLDLGFCLMIVNSNLCYFYLTCC